MFEENYSPNGFNVHKYDTENENVNEFDVTIRGNSTFKNKDDYYPDFYERQRYDEKMRLQQNIKINHVETQWDIDTRESQNKLNEIKNNTPVEIINKSEETVMNPNDFFNNTSQVYLLYNIGENLKK